MNFFFGSFGHATEMSNIGARRRKAKNRFGYRKPTTAVSSEQLWEALLSTMSQIEWGTQRMPSYIDPSLERTATLWNQPVMEVTQAAGGGQTAEELNPKIYCGLRFLEINMAIRVVWTWDKLRPKDLKHPAFDVDLID